MRILISGGPGAGCTSTAKLIGAALGLSVFDSDTFFHKPTDPPFQEPYSPNERRQLLAAALDTTSDWILSGSIATWGIDLPTLHFGVFLDPPKQERLRRLDLRERERFGPRIDRGGDLHSENKAFMEWASGYEDRAERGRNRSTDKAFLEQECDYFIEISNSDRLDDVALAIRGFLANPRSTPSRHS
jgi:adenylate kinase family enzyme